MVPRGKDSGGGMYEEGREKLSLGWLQGQRAGARGGREEVKVRTSRTQRHGG